MHKLAAICVKRPVFATMLVLALTVVGAFSYFSLGVDLIPKVDVPTVAVITTNPGASAEEIETEITKRIEDAVNTISDIDELRSTSVQGMSTVTIAFTLDKNGDVAAQEIRDKVSRVIPDLPETAETPVIQKFDPDAQPIMQIAVSAARPLRDVTDIADRQIKQRLENVKGVGEIRIVGGLRREIRVWVDPARMRAYGLSISDVANALRQQNMEMPAGSVNAGANELTVRTLGRLVDPEQFNEIAIVSRGPYVVKLRDIGHAEDSIEEAKTAARLNGEPSVTLIVSKQSGTNAVTTADGVKARLAEIEKGLPKDIHVEMVLDQSVFIKAAVEAIQDHLIEGSILASVIIYVFLANIRTTLIAAIAIPTSIISTFAMMAAMGFTLNQITMLALTLMVGVVIDDAIIVLENIYRFIEEKGLPPMRAAIEGTREIGLAVMATTLSLLAVFLPIGFMGGIVGRFMSSFGFTASFAIAVSLLVSFTLTPMLSSRFLKAPAGGGGHKGKSSKDSKFFSLIDRAYTSMLTWAMHHRKTMVGISVLVVISIVPLFMMVGKSFTPVDDRGEFIVGVRTPEGTSLAATTNVAERIARDIRALPFIIATLTTVGNGTDRAGNNASIYVKMTPMDTRDITQLQMMMRTREIFKNYPPDLRTRVGVQSWNGTADIQYSLSGPDLDKLGAYSQKLMEESKKIPNVVDVDTSLIYGKPELRVEIDRQRAADLGVRVSDIAQALNTLLAGQVVSTFPSGGEQYDVRLRAAQEFRTSTDALKQLTVGANRGGGGGGGNNNANNNANNGGGNNNANQPVSLDQVVRLKEGTAPSSIERLNRQRQVTLSANVLPGGSQADIVTSIDQAAQKLGMTADYKGAAAGQTRELARTAYYFILAVSLTFIFMYMVLAAQFESFLHPLTILLTLPLSVPFGILSLLIAGQTVNIFSGLGLLLLFGIVKKNAILQIDHTNNLREQGMGMYEAIMQANRDRLRPILMTTMALVAGMLPVVLSNKVGSASNRSIGVLVVGGQSLCLLLTLLAVPVFYSLLEDLKQSGFVRGIGNGLRYMGNRFQPASAAMQRKTEEV
ncbi:MAG: efflux RND transporter permease subunit [Acidobacteriota bacterium]